ncbi:unnamed protein product [Cuscuta epithymum]|uniref:Uncharacterized protein n=1 Tax=Cuscuta epithymum TaxID=186058 RepID=A0AAV0DEW2_9ASTE|nr:unnamed protein product [Cuscuta epithymum]
MNEVRLGGCIEAGSAIPTVVELVFTHIARVRPSPEPPLCQKELCEKILVQYYFLFSSNCFCFSLSSFGLNVRILGVLLIDRVLVPIVFRPKFALFRLSESCCFV